LEPPKRAERALHQVVSECYVQGVSTRRVDKLVRALGIEGIDKSQVSRIDKELDVRVEEFRSRPLDASPYRYVWIDALYIKVREGGRVSGCAVGVATAVSSEGHREIIALDIFDTEDGASWTAFLKSMVARGLSGVELVISDCHLGLKAAISAILPRASWQRRRTHMMRDLLTHVPKIAQDMVATIARSIFMQGDAETVRAQFTRVIKQLEAAKFNKAADILSDARDDLLAFLQFPQATLAANLVKQRSETAQ
jgi:transposase-like protein